MPHPDSTDPVHRQSHPEIRPEIRPATAADAAAIAAIWNHYIRDTAVTFNATEKPEDELREMIATRGPAFLVACDGAQVLGFATFSQFRGGIGYRHTAEHTVLFDPQAKGRGLGRALMQALFDAARAQRMHSLFAGVSAENPAGVAFHAALGFQEVAQLAQVGRKFDRWLDLVLMQKML